VSEEEGEAVVSEEEGEAEAGSDKVRSLLIASSWREMG
jgi:hypothetical protein